MARNDEVVEDSRRRWYALIEAEAILAGIAGDTEFPQFAEDFVAYMKGEEIDDEEAAAMKAPTLVMPTGKA